MNKDEQAAAIIGRSAEKLHSHMKEKEDDLDGLIAFWLSYVKEGDPEVAIDAFVDYVISNKIKVSRITYDETLSFSIKYMSVNDEYLNGFEIE